MNAAYKWYSYNNNIVQFYSGYSSSLKRYQPSVGNVKDTVEQACDYANNFVDWNESNDISSYS